MHCRYLTQVRRLQQGRPSKKSLEATGPVMPHVLSGAADLTGNTGSKLSGTVAFSSSHREGKQIYYGIREHAMGAAMVGMALHGGVLPVGGTFFVFADYMRPSIRLAALSKARCVFVFSHDSVGVGEDGPTHQPVEHLASLRAIPGLQVIRPTDANETAQAWLIAATHDGPTAIILSRQTVPAITDGSAVAPGAALLRSVPNPQVVLVGTGSETGCCVAGKRVVVSGRHCGQRSVDALVGSFCSPCRQTNKPKSCRIICHESALKQRPHSAGRAMPATPSASTHSERVRPEMS
jgi:transketolase